MAAGDRTVGSTPRDSGFKDIEAAWKWNEANLSRALLPREVRVDTTDLSVMETVQRVIDIVRP